MVLVPADAVAALATPVNVGDAKPKETTSETRALRVPLLALVSDINTKSPEAAVAVVLFVTHTLMSASPPAVPPAIDEFVAVTIEVMSPVEGATHARPEVVELSALST